MSQALVIIDIQNDYFPNGKMPLVGSEAAAENARRVLDSFRQSGQPVINVQHVSRRENAPFFAPNTFGVEIHELVKPGPEETVLVKHFPNAFRETNLAGRLEALQVDEVVVVGMMTHMCIDTSVRAASDLGFKVTLVGDACATKNLQLGNSEVGAADVQLAYLAALDGSFATVTSTDEFLSA